MNETVKGSKFKRISIIALSVLCIFSVLSRIVYEILAANDIYIYLFGTIYYGNQRIPIMLICVLGGAILFVLAGSKTSRRGAGKFILLKEIGIKTIIVVITLFALFSVYVIGWFWTVDKTFSEFESPDVNGIIVAEKWEWLAASGHTFYLKSGPFFVKKLSGSIVGKLENREY